MKPIKLKNLPRITYIETDADSGSKPSFLSKLDYVQWVDPFEPVECAWSAAEDSDLPAEVPLAICRAILPPGYEIVSRDHAGAVIPAFSAD